MDTDSSLDNTLGKEQEPASREQLLAPTQAVPLMRRRRAAIIVAIGMLGISVLATYASISANAWAKKADALHMALLDTDTRLTESEQELARVRTELKATIEDLGNSRNQLNEANARIRELVAEKSQAVDTGMVFYQLAQRSNEVVQSLDNCVRLQQQLMVYILDISRYYLPDLVRYSRDVSAACARAQTMNRQLAEEISKYS
ncbi:MAG: hypothetical protein ACOYY2_08315 [Actinomycetota bacterium]